MDKIILYGKGEVVTTGYAAGHKTCKRKVVEVRPNASMWSGSEVELTPCLHCAEPLAIPPVDSGWVRR